MIKEQENIESTSVDKNLIEDNNVSTDTTNVDNTDSDNNVANISDKRSFESDTSTETVSNDNINTDNEQQRNEQINFKALRQAKKRAEKERDELAKKIEELSNAKQNEVSDDIYEDDISKTRKEIQELKQQWQQQQNQVKARTIEEKLKSEFPDLETVVNEDNIEVLKARDPNFAKIINRAPNDPDELYHRAVAAYTLIKKYGIYVKDDHKKDREKVAKNMAKPRPASAASSSTSEGLADFSDFSSMNSEERRKAIFKLARERANS